MPWKTTNMRRFRVILEIEDRWDRFEIWGVVPAIKAHVDTLDVNVIEKNSSTTLIESDEDNASCSASKSV